MKSRRGLTIKIMRMRVAKEHARQTNVMMKEAVVRLAMSSGPPGGSSESNQSCLIS